ncbi:hypothetical protein [Rhodococcus sp. 077-4]|uniref:hypothetical protein n=1 Tax=Rhodococcus sp. 077-4 TaxID=2789271 RepID=UPI0039F4D659
MRALVCISTVTVVCSVSIGFYVAVYLATIGVIEPGPLVEVMVVLPAVVGIVAGLLGAVVGLGVLVPSTRQLPSVLMAVGHIAASSGVVAVVIWSTRAKASGWDLIFLPLPLMLAQCVVLSGLIALYVRHRRSHPAANPDRAQPK